jgi:hypothetical protein
VTEFEGLYRKVPETERNYISPFLEGKILNRGVLHPDFSEEFFDYVAYYHQVDDMITSTKIKMGYLDKDTAKNILYEPIMSLTGETQIEIENRLGDLSKLGMAYVKRTQSRKTTSATLTERVLEDIDAEKGARKLKMSQFFPEFARKTEGFQKQRGRLSAQDIADGIHYDYSVDMRDIIPTWIADYTRITATNKVLDGISDKFGIPINLKDLNVVDEVKGTMTLSKGNGQFEVFENMAIFAPDGFKRFYQAKIDYYKKVIDSLDGTTTPDELIAKAVLDSVKDVKNITGTSLGVTKNVKAFLIDKKIADELQPIMNPVLDYIRLFHDTPMAIWKRGVLSTPSWIVNNVVGDVFFAMMSNTKVGSMTDFFKSKFKDVIPLELKGANSIRVLARNEELGRAANSTIGKMINELKRTKVFQKVDETTAIPFAINNALESPFSGGFYIQLAKEEAKKLAGAGASESEIYGMMHKIAHDEKYAEIKTGLLKQVGEAYPVMSNLGRNERYFMRRLMPFYNWMKFMTVYGAKLPIKHPFKAETLNIMGNFAEEEREKLFIEHFPYMESYIKENGIPNRYSGLYPLWKDRDGSLVTWNVKGTMPLMTIKDVLFGSKMSALSPIVRIPMEVISKENLTTGKEFDYVPTEEKTGLDLDSLNIADHTLRQFPQYRLIEELMTPSRVYTETGLLGTPSLKGMVIRKANGEIKYPINRLNVILKFSGLPLRPIIDDLNLHILDEDSRIQLKKFRIGQEDDGHLSIDEMLNVLNSVATNVLHNQSEEYESVRKTIMALELVKKEIKLADEARKRAEKIK